ncbi:MAG: serine/threonine protein kinase [Calditrichaeota bacterium]|nr:MAG: serine/threonine protein kinase [Calditrichota bacterium]
MNIKNHEIIREIHRGAITTVYEARHLNLDRPVLLKVLNKQWLGEKDLMERFRREARISARLRHPNIVHIYDFEVSGQQVYISMEYVDGIPLSRYIREQGPLTPKQLRKLATDLIAALQYAHAHDVIHRDIKPANILLEKDGTARLTDFGLALFKDTQTLTRHGENVGTPAYMAPELIKGAAADVQSDLYSLGVTLFEACHGAPPFSGDNVAAVFQKVLYEEAPALESLHPESDPSLCRLIHALMSKEPARRPDMAEITSLLNGHNTTASTVSSRKPKLQRLLMVIIPLMILAAGLIYFLAPSQTAEEEKPTILKSPDTNRVMPKVVNDSLTSSPGAPRNTEPQKRPTLTRKVSESEKNIPLEKGALTVICTPWAALFLNGDSIDTTPLKSPLRLMAGNYELTLRNPNYEPYSTTIRIAPGRHDTMRVRLRKAFGYLSIQAVPWAKIYIDGVYRDDTPLARPLTVHSGRIILRLENPGLGSLTDTLHISPGSVVSRRYNLKK